MISKRVLTSRIIQNKSQKPNCLKRTKTKKGQLLYDYKTIYKVHNLQNIYVNPNHRRLPTVFNNPDTLCIIFTKRIRKATGSQITIISILLKILIIKSPPAYGQTTDVQKIKREYEQVGKPEKQKKIN